jgi:hypothetical protein
MALKVIAPDSNDRFTALIIGRAGVGKTSLLRTIPPDEPVCTLSADAGLLCIRDLVKSGQVSGVEIRSLEEMNECLYLLRNSDEWKEAYKWVFIDSLTEIAAKCVEVFQNKYPDKKDSFNLWNAYATTMTTLIKEFRDMPYYNVVFTCLETVEVDEVKRRYIAPDMPGKQLKERLPSFFDEVFYMTTIQDDSGSHQRVFYTQPIPGQPGKDRSGRLETIESPDLFAIKQKILA